ncbi:MAG: dynamin family protein [Kiritimatiellae bacterium]|nr:dynamin family protein [Kiritimatiellia bacterium]
MNTNSTPTLEQFTDGATAVLALEAALTGKPVDPELIKKIAMWKMGIFRIVVMGEIKKGKSSFINALLGHKNLVPVCSDVATSTIFKICYGEKVGYKVYFFQDSGKAPVAIQADELPAYGTEDGNPGNEKQVDFIQVFCPSPLLKAGLVIVDTPGLGGLFKQHKRITYQYVPKADAVFLVTDSVESPIGQAEIDLLGDLKKVTKHIFFVQTKSRLVDADAREARKENNIRTLAEQAGFEKDKIRYFVVDSATKFAADEEHDLKKLDRSGFGEVARFVNGYIRPNVHRLIMARAMAEMRPKIDAVSRELDAQAAILKTKNEEERQAAINELTREQEQLKAWDSTEKRVVLAMLEDGLVEVREKALDTIGAYRPNGAFHQEVSATLANLDSATQIEDALTIIQQNLSDTLSQVLYDTEKEMSQGCVKLLSEISRKIGKSVEQGVLQSDSNISVPISGVPVEINKSTMFESLRNGWFGGTFGAAIGGAIGSIVPVVGTTVGAWVGAFVGGALSGLSSNKHEMIAARNQAGAVFGGWLANAYAEMSQKIGSALDQIKRNVTRGVTEAVTSVIKEKADHIAELKQMGQKSSEEIKAKMAELQKRQQQFKQAVNDMQGGGAAAAAAKGA